MSEIPSVALLTADAPGVSALYPPQWGIFWQNGQPALVADSVGAVEYRREYSVSDYPQEQGAFASYNKVQHPFEAKVTLLSSLTRQQLLNMLEPVVFTLTLVSVVTPEISYPSANLLRYGLRRTSRNGVTLIAVDVWCKEIRIVGSPSLSSSSSAQGSNQATGGTNRPVGQVNGGSNLVPGGAQTGGSGSAPSLLGSAGLEDAGGAQISTPGIPALDTGSTNAAYPTQSGPVQPDQTVLQPIPTPF